MALSWATASTSQDVRSPILTIDSERLYRDSAFGQRVLNEIEARTSELAEDNRRIEAELEAEEQLLTDQRGEMEPDAFRALADAFDARVEVIRRDRDARSRAIADLLEENRDRFLMSAAPVLEEIMRDTGAAVILEQRSVFVSANAIDITDLAIERMDATLGDGGTQQ
ncbi:OmpH family outer membrane protein [Tateyamaria omphalii]|uniref:OmpH family outer membrane protein n=1 Tax=Tateyamaria omphalii TaxID=299262 RepID=UPI001C991840|nr:OmpH family outer membrane protein [Tateyamaria omphalii]MBY5932791.1 OmpH family outer membrane protein [Tateyamaria omphalii]